MNRTPAPTFGLQNPLSQTREWLKPLANHDNSLCEPREDAPTARHVPAQKPAQRHPAGGRP